MLTMMTRKGKARLKRSQISMVVMVVEGGRLVEMDKKVDFVREKSSKLWLHILGTCLRWTSRWRRAPSCRSRSLWSPARKSLPCWYRWSPDRSNCNCTVYPPVKQIKCDDQPPGLSCSWEEWEEIQPSDCSWCSCPVPLSPVRLQRPGSDNKKIYGDENVTCMPLFPFGRTVSFICHLCTW